MIKVSIVVPTFNRPELLSNLLGSFERQTMTDFEVIVIDDHSLDQKKYLEVIEQFSKSLNLKYFSNERGYGAPYSRNRGIKMAQADFIALVDDDDEWFPQKLEKQLELFLNSDSNVGLIYTWTRVVDSKRNLIRDQIETYEGDCRCAILQSCFIPSPSVMVRKKAIIEAGLFDETFPSCQDWDTWTRIIFEGYHVRACKEILTYYFKHDGPSIGTSPRAKLGFKMYYGKHFFKLLQYYKWRHLIRYMRLTLNL